MSYLFHLHLIYLWGQKMELEKQFDKAMLDIYLRAKKEAKYTATIFFDMLTRQGGVRTAKYLINSENPSDGYTKLNLKNRLDLTVEAVVVENAQWHSLFTPDELEKARKRLRDFRYVPKA